MCNNRDSGCETVVSPDAANKLKEQNYENK